MQHLFLCLGRAPKKWLIEEEDHVDLTGLVGVDQATLLSIDKCGEWRTCVDVGFSEGEGQFSTKNWLTPHQFCAEGACS